MTTLARALAVLLALAVASPAAAQIVNIQPLMAKVPGEGFAGELNFSLDWRDGNVSLLLVNAGFLGLVRKGVHRVILNSTVDVGWRGDQEGIDGEDQFMKRAFVHLRHQVDFGRIATWETFTQAGHDEFKRLQWRVLAGTGPRLAFVDGPAVSLAWGLAYMFEHERLSDDAGLADAGDIENNHRASTYITANFAVDPVIGLSHTTYYQPRLDDPVDDFRLSTETGLNLRASESTAVSLVLGVFHDSAPPEGIKSTDKVLKVVLTVGL